MIVSDRIFHKIGSCVPDVAGYGAQTHESDV